MAIKKDSQGNVTSVMLSRIDKDIYDHFEIKKTYQEDSYPVKLIIPENTSKNIPEMEKYLLYDDQEDFTLLYKSGQINELDIKVLRFITIFQNVQMYHVIKEYENLYTFDKIKKSLSRLKNFLLIKEYEFLRFDNYAKDGSKAKCFIATRNGMIFLQENELIDQKNNYGLLRWVNRYNEDRLNPIRLWKVCDAYQVVSNLKGFKNFKSRVFINSKTYSRTININGKTHIKQQYVEKLWLNGEIEMEGVYQDKTLTYFFDLLPYIDNELSNDNELLRLALIHFGILKKERNDAIRNGKNGRSTYEKMLVVIVDDWSVAESIITNNNLDNYDGLVSFLDLSSVQNDNLLDSIVTLQRLLDEDNRPLKEKDGSDKMAWQPIRYNLKDEG